MGGIRTILIGMSPMFGDIIKKSVAEHIALDIVGESQTHEALGDQLQSVSPELILVELHGGEPDAIGFALLALVPGTKVIAFSSDKHHAYVYERRACRTMLADVSPEALIKEISR